MGRLFSVFSILFLLCENVSAQAEQFFLVNLALKENSLLSIQSDQELLNRYYSKLSSMCTKVDGVIVDEHSDYFLLTDVVVLKQQKSSAGFLPVLSFEIELSLNLVYQENGVVFKTLRYRGDYVSNSEKEAIENLIYNFDFAQEELKSFFAEGRKKMRSYYTSNCLSIIETAKKYQNIGEPEKALAICLAIPDDLPCYENVSVLIQNLYTSLSYKNDYQVFIKANDLVSKGDYSQAFALLSSVSIYSDFYKKSNELALQIKEYIFNQNELKKKIELAESQQKVKEAEIILQQKRNELQTSINQTNVLIQDSKNKSDQYIANQNFQNQKVLKGMELQSNERRETIRAASNLIGAYLSKPEPPRNTNFYIIK